jgi:PadR family transcriptional regulator PadR
MVFGMTSDATLSSHLQELRRGTVVVASLTVLRTPGYGYSLLETLSAAGFEVEANTLYPLLRRLESQGLLTSAWNTDEARPRKFYRTTEQGDAVATALRTEWTRLNRAVSDLGTTTTITGATTGSGNDQPR